MQITYLADMIGSTDFVYALIFLTFVIWMILKVLFNYDNFSKSLLFAVFAMVFLPLVLTAMQIWAAFVIVLVLGAFGISSAFKWPLSTSMLAILIAMIAGMIVIPAL